MSKHNFYINILNTSIPYIQNKKLLVFTTLTTQLLLRATSSTVNNDAR